MKKILYTLLAGAMALASCSKEATDEFTSQTETTTFTLSVDQLQTPGAETRVTSAITPARYVMEVWSEDGTTAENVFENGTKNHAELLASSGSSFTVSLDKTKAYICLFWADDNTTYNAASLKTIVLNAGKDMNEAYHAKVSVPKGKNPAVAVTLKRAVAKVVLTETAAVETSNDLKLKFTNIYPAFNVLDGTATGTTADWTKTVKPTATTGTISTFYFFAKPAQELSEFSFTYASETEKSVSNVPYQMNYATNIKGQYSSIGLFTFTVTADDEWNTPGNEVDFDKKSYKVGDLYPDAAAPVGVVF